MNIVITGSIAYDYIMSFPGKFTDMLLADQLHNISVSFLVDSLKRHRGGTAPNIAYTLALLGARPTIMATAGQDFSDYRHWLEKQGVDTSAIVEIEDEYCASFFVNTDENLNQIASFYTGAMSHAKGLSFATHAPATGLATVSPNDPDAMRAYAAECKRLQIPYLYDPSQQIARLSGDDLREGLDGCFLLTVNEYEYGVIREKTGLNEAQILQRVGGLLVTRGAEGSTLIINNDVFQIPAVTPSHIVDPTGAGDAYRAGLMRGMQLDLPWDIAGRMGALAATYVLENLGTQNHTFTPAAFVARYREYFDDNGRLDCLTSNQ